MDDGPGDVGYMAPTLGQAKRLLWRPLMQDLRNPEARAFLAGRPNNSELSIEFKSGTRLYLYSAEAFERVRGDGFKLFITDETDDPRFTDEVFDEVIGPALSDNLGSLIQLGTPKGRGRLYREFNKGDPNHRSFDPQYASIQVTAMEAGIIDRAEIERARATRTARAFAQEYLANFNAPVGIVYEEWDPKVHVVTNEQIPRRFDYTIAGVDWGSAARGAMLIIGIDRVHATYEGERPRAWVLAEESAAGIPYTDDGWWRIAQEFDRDYAPVAWYCDPAGGMDKMLEQLKQALRKVGAKTQVVAADNKVRPGIAAVQEMLHHDPVLGEEPHLFVSDKCPQLIQEFANYRYRSHRNIEGEYVDEVVKESDHCLDSARYAIHTRFFSRTPALMSSSGGGFQ
jgi:hypothetical protein